MALIYKCTNTVNGKIYVGKTVLSLQSRIRKHLAYKRSPCQVIQFALAKYGSENFVWEILEVVDEPLLNQAEIRWISLLNSTHESVGYNRSHGGDGRSHFTDSEATKAKKSAGMKGKTNSCGPRKHPMSESHRSAISKALKGKSKNFGARSESHRNAISMAMKGKTKSLEHRQAIAEGVSRYLRRVRGQENGMPRSRGAPECG